MGLYDPKKLGFGCMRLHTFEDGNVDLEEMKQMVDLFIGRGFTYFDTAYVYLGGKSETAIREAVVKRYPRDSFTVADKLPSWSLNDKSDVERIFAEQKERLGVDYFDFYLLHNVNSNTIGKFDEADCWTWLEGKKNSGEARNVGFSFHDTPEMLDRVLTEHPFVDFVQLQINYLDWDAPNVQSGGVWATARKHGKRVVIMEPIKGGYLATPIDEAKKILDEAVPGASPATVALRFAASLDGVLVVLSGMNTVAQMEDNTSAFADFVPLTEEQTETVHRAAEAIKSIPMVGCTSCRYCCDGCPMSIEIPKLISSLNNMRRFGVSVPTLNEYRRNVGDGGSAADCIGCGQCESVCPQHLPIPELMNEIAELTR